MHADRYYCANLDYDIMCSPLNPPRYSTLRLLPLHCLQILESFNPISHYTALQFSSQEVTGASSPEFVTSVPVLASNKVRLDRPCDKHTTASDKHWN